MNKKILLFIISLLFPLQLFAASLAGLVPTNFFYFLDIFAENISITFTFNEEKEVAKRLEYANERLAEAEVMVEKGRYDKIKKILERYSENTEKVKKYYLSSEIRGTLSFEDDIATLEKMASSSPENYKELFEKVRNKVYSPKKQDVKQTKKQNQERIATTSQEIITNEKIVEQQRSKEEQEKRRKEERKIAEQKLVIEIAKKLAEEKAAEEEIERIEAAEEVHKQKILDMQKLAEEQKKQEELDYIKNLYFEQVKNKITSYQEYISKGQKMYEDKYIIYDKGIKICNGIYNSRVEQVQSEGDIEITRVLEARGGFAIQRVALDNLKESIQYEIERETWLAEDEKQTCLAKYYVDDSISSRLSKLSSELSLIQNKLNRDTSILLFDEVEIVGSNIANVIKAIY
ncbi:MAG: hypothetical protein KAR24_01560 [Candidatus Pacebacteria bacterium]|nr:hypothetical protein [Candidatus Paceibacterota bacterium]